MKIKIPYFSFIVFIVMSCSNVSEDDLLEPITIAPGVTVNYTDNIASIMQNNCLPCHGNPAINGANLPLTTFSEVVLAVNSAGLINRISSQTGESGAMPLGGPRLPQNLIDLVVQWQTDGLLEN